MMTNFAALMGALVKRGSWAGPTLTAATAELGARVRFTGGALAGNEGTVITGGHQTVTVRLDSGHVRQRIPLERCQLVGKLAEAEIQKLRVAIAASPPVPSYSPHPGGTQVTIQPPPGGWTSPTITVNVAPAAPVEAAPSRPPPPPKKKAKPLRRKGDWDF